MNGDTMLLRQTAAAFNLWTGRDVSVDLLQQQLDKVRESGPAVATAAAAAVLVEEADAVEAGAGTDSAD
jgi:hypothetical protein